MKPETECLQHLMKLKGWEKNQIATAQALGVTQATVSRLLNELVPMHGSTKVLLEKLIKEAEQSLELDQKKAGSNSGVTP